MTPRLFPGQIERPWFWSVTNVSGLLGGGPRGPEAPGQGGAHAYSVDDPPFGVGGFTIYVTYVALTPDAIGEVHQLQYALALGAWQDVNLTEQTGCSPAWVSSPVAYLFRSEGTFHVFYLGWDGPLSSAQDLHIDELCGDQNGWNYNNLTGALGAPPPSSASPCAYAAEFEQTQHVLYIGEDGHLNHLWWDQNGWNCDDLTNATAAPLALVRTSPAGFVSETGGTQSVHYVGGDGQLHGLRAIAGGWGRHDADMVIPPAAPTSPVGYFSNGGIERVVYLGGDGHVNELSFDGSAWQLEDVSQDTNVSFDPKTPPALAAYQGLDPGTRRIVVIPAGGALVQQFSNYGGPWNHRVLLDTNSTNDSRNGDAPDAGARPGAFAAAAVGQEYVFFPSVNFQITELAGPYIPVNE